MIKKIFCLFLVLIMIFAFSVATFATATSIVKDRKNIQPQITVVGNGSGKSVEGKIISDKFTLNSKHNMRVNVRTNFPTIVVFKFKDSNGKSLGTASLTVIKEGSYTFVPTPSSLSAGSYSYELFFNDSDVTYTYSVEAI